MSQTATKIGEGEFGDIYTGVKGQDAINHLLKMRGGEVVGAITHPTVGDIDLVWGDYNSKTDTGYGIAKLEQKHPEVLQNLEQNIKVSKVVSQTPNRIKLLKKDGKITTVIRLDWNGRAKKWLLTHYDV